MKKNICFLSLILISFWGNGQVDRSIKPAPGKAASVEFKNTDFFTTQNGIKVILSENHKLPKVSFSLTLGYNPGLEGFKAGLGELAGSLVMSGTQNRTKDQLDREVDFIGASLDASSTRASLSCMTKHMEKGLELMSDICRNANFPKSEFERVVKQYESNLVSLKSEGSAMAGNAVAKVNFPNHPYGEVMTTKTLASITLEDVMGFYKANYSPVGAYLVIVGDINRTEAAKMVEKYFGTWNGPSPNQPKFNDPRKTDGNQVFFINKPGAVQSVVQVTFPISMRMGDPNNLRMTVLNDLFGGSGFGTRLMQNLREGKAFTYGCYSQLNNQSNGGWISAGGNFRNAVTDSAITEILYEFNRLNKETVSTAEIDLTKSVKAGSFGRSLEQAQTIARFAFNIEKYGLPKDYYKTYLQNLASITPEDLRLTASNYIKTNNYNIIVVGNEEVLESLKKFDSDGKITKLDEFGDPKSDMLPADINLTQLSNAYLQAVTQTKSLKAAQKKIKSVKSLVQTSSLSSDKIPVPLSTTEIYSAKGIRAEKMEFNKTAAQKSYFDGKTGYEFSMQEGKKDMTPDKMNMAKFELPLFFEVNYASNTRGLKIELLGLEPDADKLNYVVKITDGKNETFHHYDQKSFMKMKTIKVINENGESQTVSTEYNDFKAVNGFLFPHSSLIALGQMGLKGQVESIVINGPVDFTGFE